MVRLRCVFVGTVLAALCSATAGWAAERLTAGQMRADVDRLETRIAAIHPDISHSVDPAVFAQAVEALRQKARDGLDRDAVWRELATLNPLLADGHLFVGYADWRGDTLRHLASGGALFPFEVAVGVDGRVQIVSELGGSRSAHAGAYLQSINGHPASEVTQSLLARVHGDSPAFRADLLSRRWWFYFWKVYGAPDAFDVVLAGPSPNTVHKVGSHTRPATMTGEEDFGRQFALEFLPDRVAVMTVHTFAWHDPEAFFAFTRGAFRQLNEARTRLLVIDVRRNGGGDDALWLKGLLPYLADRPYRWASRYTKRVLKDNPAQQEKAGEVLSGDIATWTSPLADDRLHFAGKLVVLVGAGTYSSAVLFANTVQDFRFGTVAGEGASVRSTQTGGIQKIELPNTGLVVWSPRFILERPSGSRSPVWLTPDVLVADDPLDSKAAVRALLAQDPGGANGR
ncbi:S41 family peptidase [Roseateles amylovorans]|uniref:S41 family peptidase n=1 Tax=Roseateles amylovorans TaxID=2978473 RepID=A0ABY6AVN2_9BURK|nr:S41 family peptidase [Roseateles amylovorans]UXH76742.1 S41 family peptidase [Roseateles amylovorans]